MKSKITACAIAAFLLPCMANAQTTDTQRDTTTLTITIIDHQEDTLACDTDHTLQPEDSTAAKPQMSEESRINEAFSNIKIKKDTIPARPHQRFKGVELSGSTHDFARAMKAAGFSLKSGKFEGIFSGYQVKVGVLVTPLSRTVYGVKVEFPSYADFASAQKEYDTFKRNMTDVYGKPAGGNEKFMAPYSAGDGYSMRALSENKAIFWTEWVNDYGIISCHIVYCDENRAALNIVYKDIYNYDVNLKEQQIQIQQDL